MGCVRVPAGECVPDPSAIFAHRTGRPPVLARRFSIVAGKSILIGLSMHPLQASGLVMAIVTDGL